MEKLWVVCSIRHVEETILRKKGKEIGTDYSFDLLKFICISKKPSITSSDNVIKTGSCR